MLRSSPFRLLLLALVALAAAQSPSPPDSAPSTEVEDSTDEVDEAVADSSADSVDNEEGEEATATAAAEQEEEEEEEAAAEETAPASAPTPPEATGTGKMRAQLSKLGYSGAEISALQPERAAAVVKHSISRPATGVPASWNVGGKPSSGARSAVMSGGGVGKRLQTAVPLVVAPALLLLGGIGALSKRGPSPAMQAAVASALSDSESVEAVTKAKTSELWLDRQIDKLIDMLKALLGK